MSPNLLGRCLFPLLVVAAPVMAEPVQATLMFRFFGYVPNTTLSLVAGIIYLVLGFVLAFIVVRHKNWWALCLPIGAIGSGIGFFFRRQMPSHPDSKGILIAQQVFVVCMPALFLAFNYIVYGRLLLYTLGRRHTLLRPTIIATVFVSSDILTFLVQAIGGSISINQKTADLGRNIFKIGIILQAVSYFIFIFLIIYTHIHVKREGRTTGRERWWIIFWSIYFSSILITIRSIFRLIEQFEGKSSIVVTQEAYFYVLDVLALMLAIAVYIPWWPAKYMFTDTIVDPDAYKMEDRRLQTEDRSAGNSV